MDIKYHASTVCLRAYIQYIISPNPVSSTYFFFIHKALEGSREITQQLRALAVQARRLEFSPSSEQGGREYHWGLLTSHLLQKCKLLVQ